jgi:pyruvate/2-oxoglutarate dehydrogenase complex dihydrolipoamide acyltransferase (E2) component
MPYSKETLTVVAVPLEVRSPFRVVVVAVMFVAGEVVTVGGVAALSSVARDAENTLVKRDRPRKAEITQMPVRKARKASTSAKCQMTIKYYHRQSTFLTYT